MLLHLWLTSVLISTVLAGQGQHPTTSPSRNNVAIANWRPTQQLIKRMQPDTSRSTSDENRQTDSFSESYLTVPFSNVNIATPRYVAPHKRANLKVTANASSNPYIYQDRQPYFNNSGSIAFKTGESGIFPTSRRQNNFNPWAHLNRKNNQNPSRLRVPNFTIMVPQVDDKELQYVSNILFESDINNYSDNADIIYENKFSSVISRIRLRDGGRSNLRTTYRVLDDIFRLHKGQIIVPRNTNPNEKEKLEDKFLDEIMKTPVIKNLFSYLAHKNLALTSIDKQRDFLKQIWFTRFVRTESQVDGTGNRLHWSYSTAAMRRRRKVVQYKSCAFEHVFRGEATSQGFSGLHNWYMIQNYLGNGELRIEERHSYPYRDPKTPFKVVVDLKIWSLNYAGNVKDSSVLFGSSPELDIALATLCFIFRTNEKCTLALGYHKMSLKVATWDIGRQDLWVIASYYPTYNKTFNKPKDDMAPFQRYRRDQMFWPIPTAEMYTRQPNIFNRSESVF